MLVRAVPFFANALDSPTSQQTNKLPIKIRLYRIIRLSSEMSGGGSFLVRPLQRQLVLIVPSNDREIKVYFISDKEERKLFEILIR